jgi:hypothetical protein
MDATPYTGTGSTLAVTNTAGFKPDLVWIKDRSNSANHCLIDSNRGVDSILFSDLDVQQDNDASYGIFTSFNSNGFTVGNGTAQNYGSSNANTQTYVGWQWQAGQGTTSNITAGQYSTSPNVPSIASTVSVNATAGFSVVTYTGTGISGGRVGHGLGVAPKMIIAKQRGSGGTNWAVYHASLPSAFGVAGTQVMYLNATTENTQNFDVWDSNDPTSSVFSVGASTLSNASSGTYVAYCWAEIAGFSKFGSYTGNGDPNGPFIYTGFRPKFVIIKASSTGGAGYDWFIHDTSRDTYNVCTLDLEANLSLSENQYGAEQDIVSNGFKLRNAGGGTNQSSVTYIYAAFAENPFKNALAR